MLTVSKALTSSLGKKFLMALTGLALTGFLVSHLLGNLLLYKSNGTSFNNYAFTLEGWGVYLYIAEIGLLLAFIVHVIAAFTVKREHVAARPVGYKMSRGKGVEQSNLASRNMIISGIILLIFLILHILQFKYGPGRSAGYVTPIHGEQARDLYRLVHETFQQPLYVFIYVASMLFLGAHLRHGFWSAFQSLGAMTPRLQKPIYALGFLVAFVMAAGFLFIPVWIYFDLSRFLGGA